MSDITCYIFTASPPCRAVLMLAKELNIPLDVKIFPFGEKEHLNPEFLKINPEHKVPTIVEGDFILAESRAIMRYFVAKFGGEDNALYPKDLQKRAIVDRYLDYDAGTFFPVFVENLVKPFFGGTPATEENNKKIAELYQWVEDHLQETPYLTSSTMTLADISFISAFGANAIYKPGMSKYPKAMEWAARMSTLPYYAEINDPMNDFVKLKLAEQAEKEKATEENK